MMYDKLREVLKKHLDWLNSVNGGIRANLREANLRDADLRDANLWGANLWGADLRDADLWRADLRGAENYFPDLYILKSQEKIIAYKLINEEYEGIFNGGLKYEVGKEITEKEINEDERILCEKGINVATLEWCQRNKRGETDKILKVEIIVKGNKIIIPFATDGKFRVMKCKVLKEVV